jgi:hypothetical protein
MILLAISMEILLAFSKKQIGFTNAIVSSGNDTLIRWFYSFIIVLLSLPVSAAFGWLDIDIKSIQPYLDLSRGDASADTSILLDYNQYANFLIPLQALKNRHYLTLTSSLREVFSSS